MNGISWFYNTESCLSSKLPFQEKHVKQQASIIGNLEYFGVINSSLVKEQCDVEGISLDKIDYRPAVVEFGAGRGYLTQMLADCYGIDRVFLVERKSYKLKVCWFFSMLRCLCKGYIASFL